MLKITITLDRNLTREFRAVTADVDTSWGVATLRFIDTSGALICIPLSDGNGFTVEEVETK